MVKTISFKNIAAGTSRSITKKFKDIVEAYLFAHTECKQGEYIEHVI